MGTGFISPGSTGAVASTNSASSASSGSGPSHQAASTAPSMGIQQPYPAPPGMPNPYYYSPYYPGPVYYQQQYNQRGYQGMYQGPRTPYMYQENASPMYAQYEGMYGVGMHAMQHAQPAPATKGGGGAKSGGAGGSSHHHAASPAADAHMGISAGSAHSSYAPYYGSRDAQPWSYQGQSWAHAGMIPGYQQSSPTAGQGGGASFSSMRK
jgi:hypothetical protein